MLLLRPTGPKVVYSGCLMLVGSVVARGWRNSQLTALELGWTGRCDTGSLTLNWNGWICFHALPPIGIGIFCPGSCSSSCRSALCRCASAISWKMFLAHVTKPHVVRIFKYPLKILTSSM
uniref:Putative secreted protein n=1 Tax=Anopheles darlingi TaxID=43151 RepID=A0A2M4DHC3_ANODA